MQFTRAHAMRKGDNGASDFASYGKCFCLCIAADTNGRTEFMPKLLFPFSLAISSLGSILQERAGLLQTPGVIGFAATSARPTAIPNEEIADASHRDFRAQSRTTSVPYPWSTSARCVGGVFGDGRDSHPAQTGVPCRRLHRSHQTFHCCRGK